VSPYERFLRWYTKRPKLQMTDASEPGWYPPDDLRRHPMPPAAEIAEAQRMARRPSLTRRLADQLNPPGLDEDLARLFAPWPQNLPPARSYGIAQHIDRYHRPARVDRSFLVAGLQGDSQRLRDILPGSASPAPDSGESP
jgi:hypothetical protein